MAYAANAPSGPSGNLPRVAVEDLGRARIERAGM